MADHDRWYRLASFLCTVCLFCRKQKQELIAILNRLQKAHINTVLIQTRVRGTMIYPSAYEPWDGCLSGFPGKSPGYDALKFAIKECHKRGMECHAWVVTIPVGKWNALGCKQLRSRFPGVNQENRTRWIYESGRQSDC